MSKKGILIVTLALLLSNAMAGLDGTIVNTALPAIISDLHGIQYMGWIVAVFLLGMAVVTPLWSKLGERIGNRRTYQIATLLFAIGSIFQALSSNIIFFLIARTIMGIGAGGMNTIPFIIYADLYTNLRKRAKVIGYATASFSAAAIIGPLIGGWIVDTFSWHWVFYINVPIALISILSVQIFFKEPKKISTVEKIDYLGAVIMIVSLVTLLTGIQMIETASLSLVSSLIIISLILLIVLFKVEEKAADPIIPNRLFRNGPLVVDFVLFSLLWGAFVAFNIYIPMWAQGLLGLSALIGGVTQIPGSITNFLGSVVGPAMQPGLGKYRTIALGTLAFIISFGIMALAGIAIPLWGLLIAGAFEGFGLGLSFNILQISVQQDAEKRDIPIATSFAYLLRILSQTFMSSIYGVILNNALNKGVAESHGEVTIEALNKLSDSQSAGDLPKNLLPLMKQIMYGGLHNIMLVALVLLAIALVFNIGIQLKVKKK
ncbi:MFS transporter [Clostridium sp. 2-1]|uniref:MFS transporter n=1 Tax=Clostridium TaxID=1485 RepID=UPI000CDA7DD8|nr:MULTISPECIES: MFS transporter [Clostridium]MBN7572451.1 MFS transporter [Clostridium beijerinckii]MBN7577395.1 MFS transporter [Clostridium beijerinckii]MBN7582224.1 MFS transporter [Clostridium beijerinckii]MBO0518570.1 MFS transporter [Clostridium beijerinckii]NOW02953.1 EmrB/QacA subfamily drug resistance transporter [Clostridium beijerinckii]